MNKLKKLDWFLFGEWFDVYWFHSCYVDGLAFTIKERLGYGLSQMVVEQDANIMRIMFSCSEWTDIGQRWLEEIVLDHNKLAVASLNLRQASDELNNLSDELYKLNIDLLNTEQVMKWLKKYHEKHFAVWSIGMLTNVLELENSFLADYLKDWLKKTGLNNEEVVEAFQALSTPRELSAAQKEEREMLKLSSIRSPQEDLIKHWKKYSWLHFGWTGPSLNLDYFKSIHLNLFNEGKAQEKLFQILSKDKQLLADKDFWIKKLNISNKMVDLFRQMEELLYMKTYRMDALYRSFEAIQPLLKKIVKDNYLSLTQIYFLPIPLLIEMLEKKTINHDFINELGKYSARYFDGEKIYLLVGDEAKEIVTKAKKSLPKQKEINELKGECAYPGKVSGRVVVVNRAEEMSKFQEGDILVSVVTDPSLLPIMKKASAFVTNQGGLTCHAAIVARELHIPCVIGTKNATYILKDGDLVEVNATEGIVKKL